MSTRAACRRVLALLAFLLPAVQAPDPDLGSDLRLVSRRPDGRAADGRSGLHGLALSGDGRRLLFGSEADDLVAGDGNRQPDVFLREDTGALQLLSRGADGRPGDAPSRDPALSGDGRWAAFASHARNLDPAKTAPWSDVFLVELETGRRLRVSRGPAGGDGTGNSARPALSHGGRRLVFESHADNLVPGDTNRAADVFLYDRTTGRLRRLSQAADGGQASGHSTHPSISADGRFVSFTSDAPDLVPGDDNGAPDVFVVELATGAVERVNVEGRAGDDTAVELAAGRLRRSSLSRDGRHVAFLARAADARSPADDAADAHLAAQVYVRDRQTGETRRISGDGAGGPADDACFAPTLSADGRTVAFLSRARNLHPDDGDHVADLYLHDLASGRTSIVSCGRVPGERGDCEAVALSADAGTLLFASRGSDLAPQDDNFTADVFLQER